MRAQQTLATAVAALAAGAMAFPRDPSPYTGVVQRSHPKRGRRAADDKKGVFMMNRIAPATSEIYVANADGTGETLLLGNSSAFDYHASWSPDGQWVTFTSERGGDGQSDLYRVRADGSGAVEAVVATPSFEDRLVLSPDGATGAYVSTANGYVANIWVVDLATGATRNLTDTALARTNVSNDLSPRGHFSPAWSPDGEWIAFSSDRETAWTGHSNGSGWEHTQALSIYAIKPDGTGFRQVATNGSDMSRESIYSSRPLLGLGPRHPCFSFIPPPSALFSFLFLVFPKAVGALGGSTAMWLVPDKVQFPGVALPISRYHQIRKIPRQCCSCGDSMKPFIQDVVGSTRQTSVHLVTCSQDTKTVERTRLRACFVILQRST